MQYVLLEIETIEKMFLVRTTIRQYENMQFDVEVMPKKYVSMSAKEVEEHKERIAFKKLGLKVKEIVSVKEVKKDYIKVLIASKEIAKYDVRFSLDTLCTIDVLICNAIKPNGFCIIPDNLVKCANENRFVAVKLSDYLKAQRTRISGGWLK